MKNDAPATQFIFKNEIQSGPKYCHKQIQCSLAITDYQRVSHSSQHEIPKTYVACIRCLLMQQKVFSIPNWASHHVSNDSH